MTIYSASKLAGSADTRAFWHEFIFRELCCGRSTPLRAAVSPRGWQRRNDSKVHVV